MGHFGFLDNQKLHQNHRADSYGSYIKKISDTAQQNSQKKFQKLG